VLELDDIPPSAAVRFETSITDVGGRRYVICDTMSRHECETWVEFFLDLRGICFELNNSRGDVRALKRLYNRFSKDIAGKWPMEE